jgi:hypothetical protein
MWGAPGWTKSQDEALAAGWANPRLSADDVADILWVTRDAALHRAIKLKLPRKAIAEPPRLIGITGTIAKVWIPGCGGEETWLDISDFEWFMTYAGGWFAHHEGGVTYVWSRDKPHKKLHRLLLAAKSGVLIDHIDRNGLNNSRSNLRIATRAQNNHNSGRRKQASSQFKGVWKHVSGLFGGMVTSPAGKRLSIGYHHTEREAARSHDAIVYHLRGDFAYLNLPNELLCPEEIAARPSVAKILATYEAAHRSRGALLHNHNHERTL